jgi:hypothetical protein
MLCRGIPLLQPVPEDPLRQCHPLPTLGIREYWNSNEMIVIIAPKLREPHDVTWVQIESSTLTQAYVCSNLPGQG